MPSVSQSQQKLMAQAYQVRKWKDSDGEEGIDPSSIEKEYRDQIESLVDSMTKAQLKDFAETKIKKLPKVKENLTGFLSGGPFPQFYSFVSNVAPQLPYASHDRKDELIKKFIDFIENGDKVKKKKEKSNEAVAAVVPVGTAQPNNTPGMGNAAPPSAGNVGSGDRFDSSYDKSKNGIMSYEDYKKWLKNWHKEKNKKNNN
jgi:hypothetical protein